MHVYRWDLDKTYLETDFDSIRGLVRSATEPASAKRSVPGARAIMAGLSARPSVRTYIVSGSPTQMRPVIEEKLRLDGVRWDHLTLKDNLGNLKRRRFRAIRGQFGYKLPVLLSTRVGLGRAVKETCFGDDAEIDAVVYSVYADAVAGRLDADDVSRVMEVAGAYPDEIETALHALERVAIGDVVERIYIRLERRVPAVRFRPLGPRLVPVHSWWQAALCLYQDGHLDVDALMSVLDAIRRERGLDSFALAGLTQDIVRRGHLAASVLDGVEREDPWLDACRVAVDQLRDRDHAPPPQPETIDYVRLVREFTGKE
ncbi:MAG: hypothetical protein D6798_05810 [Deltaproteobacteria bacterium]|nr:MAG: hypothetical protein D6798_05810 [Deltaproteobacteria bacterium]